MWQTWLTLHWSEIPASCALAVTAFTWPNLGNKEGLSQNLLIQITWWVGGGLVFIKGNKRDFFFRTRVPVRTRSWKEEEGLSIYCHTFIPRWGRHCNRSLVSGVKSQRLGKLSSGSSFCFLCTVKVRQSYPDLLRNKQLIQFECFLTLIIPVSNLTPRCWPWLVNILFSHSHQFILVIKQLLRWCSIALSRSRDILTQASKTLDLTLPIMQYHLS